MTNKHGAAFTFREREHFLSFGRKAPELTTARHAWCKKKSFSSIFFSFDLKIKDRHEFDTPYSHSTCNATLNSVTGDAILSFTCRLINYHLSFRHLGLPQTALPLNCVCTSANTGFTVNLFRTLTISGFLIIFETNPAQMAHVVQTWSSAMVCAMLWEWKRNFSIRSCIEL